MEYCLNKGLTSIRYIQNRFLIQGLTSTDTQAYKSDLIEENINHRFLR